MRRPATSFRAKFDCLWCGRPWTAANEAALEGWAQLCSTCVGKADENPFVRFRVRRALTDRAAAQGEPEPAAPEPEPAAPEPEPAAPEPEAPPPTTEMASTMIEYYAARAAEYDDWYLRRGRYAHGPVHDTAWKAELDAAGRWLDDLPIRGRIVELAAGTGWWSPLLAGKG
jgi:hypothetical protein